jgi:hypothetical protein
MVGAGFGFGMSFWAMRALRRVAYRTLPPALLERLERRLDALDGGTGAPRGALRLAGAVAPWRSSGTPHPSTTGLRALVGGRGGAG